MEVPFYVKFIAGNSRKKAKGKSPETELTALMGPLSFFRRVFVRSSLSRTLRSLSSLVLKSRDFIQFSASFQSFRPASLLALSRCLFLCPPSQLVETHLLIKILEFSQTANSSFSSVISSARSHYFSDFHVARPSLKRS